MYRLFKPIINTFLIILVSASALAEAESKKARGISYRAIIYFNPEIKVPEKERLKKYFQGYEPVSKLPKIASKPLVSYRVLTDFKASYPAPDASYLSYFGRGITKGQVRALEQTKAILVAEFAYPINYSVPGLKSANNAIYEIAKEYNSVIWDSETRELFGLEAWREQRLDAWQGDIPTVEKHVIIHAYKNKEYTRAITLGMGKFGLPDIVVNEFSWSLNKQMGNLITLAAQSMAEGKKITKNNTLYLAVDKLKNTQFKTEIKSSLMDGAEGKVELKVGKAKWEEGDPYNYLMELLFTNVDGKTTQERQEALLSKLFGWEDSISYVKHNELIIAASERAKAKLPKLKAEFEKGLPPGEFIMVKAPFATPGGGNEWMWVEIISWKGSKIKGLLKNEPFNIPDLRGGAEVVVEQSEIFDYIRNYPDGTSEGNETGALILKYQKYSQSSKEK